MGAWAQPFHWNLRDFGACRVEDTWHPNMHEGLPCQKCIAGFSWRSPHRTDEFGNDFLQLACFGVSFVYQCFVQKIGKD